MENNGFAVDQAPAAGRFLGIVGLLTLAMTIPMGRQATGWSWILVILFGFAALSCLLSWVRSSKSARRHGEVRLRYAAGPSPPFRLGDTFRGTVEGTALPAGPWRYRLICEVGPGTGNRRERHRVTAWTTEWTSPDQECCVQLPPDGLPSDGRVRWKLEARAGDLTALFEIPVARREDVVAPEVRIELPAGRGWRYGLISLGSLVAAVGAQWFLWTSGWSGYWQLSCAVVTCIAMAAAAAALLKGSVALARPDALTIYQHWHGIGETHSTIASCEITRFAAEGCQVIAQTHWKRADLVGVALSARDAREAAAELNSYYLTSWSEREERTRTPSLSPARQELHTPPRGPAGRY